MWLYVNVYLHLDQPKIEQPVQILMPKLHGYCCFMDKPGSKVCQTRTESRARKEITLNSFCMEMEAHILCRVEKNNLGFWKPDFT